MGLFWQLRQQGRTCGSEITAGERTSHQRRGDSAGKLLAEDAAMDDRTDAARGLQLSKSQRPSLINRIKRRTLCCEEQIISGRVGQTSGTINMLGSALFTASDDSRRPSSRHLQPCLKGREREGLEAPKLRRKAPESIRGRLERARSLREASQVLAVDTSVP